MTYVFVYGTLKAGYGNHHLLNRAWQVGPGRTKKPEFTMINGGFPWSIPEGNSYVIGELYEVDDDLTMKNLDRLEGVPSLFERYSTEVEVNGETYPAIMYVAAKNRRAYLLERATKVIPDENNGLTWSY